jgi:hypothetical protein
MRTLAAMVALSGLAWAAAEQPGVAAPGPGAVMPRGKSEVSLGEPTEVSLEGVSVVRERGADGRPSKTTLVGWDRVLEVRGALSTDATGFAGIADSAWRARVRLERGDIVAAEPLFEGLFETYRGREGPTAQAVAGGLLRCRVARGSVTASVEPWLAWLWTGGGMPLGETLKESVGAEVTKLVDASTGLMPGLPPMWLASPGVAALGRLEPAGVVGTGGVKPAPWQVRSDSLRNLYILAASAEMGGVGQAVVMPERGVGANDPGVRLVYDVVKAKIGDAAQRAEARRALNDRLVSVGGQASPAWVEAWCRVAIGRSLLVETNQEDRLMGLASLAYVASRWSPDEVYLAGLATAEMALALSKDGREAQAAALANQAATRFPDHPALESPVFARWMVARSAKQATTPSLPMNPNQEQVSEPVKKGE